MPVIPVGRGMLYVGGKPIGVITSISVDPVKPSMTVVHHRSKKLARWPTWCPTCKVMCGWACRQLSNPDRIVPTHSARKKLFKDHVAPRPALRMTIP